MTEPAAPPPLLPALPARLQRAAGLWPGALSAAVVALAASFVAGLHGGPQMLYALLFGVAFHYQSQEARTAPGIEFCARTVLRLGIGLLGARITAAQIAALGWTTVLALLAAVLTTLACGLWLARRLRLSASLGVLAGGATAICGASAALAIAAVLPRDKELDRSTVVVVVLATALSTLAMLLYPLVARALALPPALAGLFLGGSIHDVAQVVVAGYTLGPQAGDTATVVKLFRVALLALVVMAVGFAFRRTAADGPDGSRAAKGAAPRRGPPLPGFMVLFFAMVALHSLGLLPPPLQAGLTELSRGCLLVAAAALGMKSSVVHLARSGWRPLLLMTVTSLWLAGFVLLAALALRSP